MTRCRVGFHSFRTYAGHPGRDGANFAYAELGRLMRASPDLDTRPHDLVELCRSDAAARAALADCDVVVGTAGPHAHLYLYLRERLGLTFRLVRDVRTALWNGYLQQEVLAAAYLRPGDVLVHSSRYSLNLYSALLPHLAGTAQVVCYPLVHWFPGELEKTWTGSDPAGPRRIGFVGRLTEDKNYQDALDVLGELQRRRPHRFELHAVGETAGPPRTPPAGLRWTPPVDRGDVWSRYREFDLLFFPSTSSLETFGRVLIEASFIGTPILSSTHAATSELLPPSSLLDTEYRTGHEFTTHFAGQLGRVDVTQAADRIIGGDLPPPATAHRGYAGHDRAFLDLVRAGAGATSLPAAAPTPIQQRFIARVRMTGLEALLDATTADATIGQFRRHFVALHRRGRPAYGATLGTLLARSRHRRKTLDFIRRSVVSGEDFTNIGGVDLQLSHLIGFEPRFRLAAQPPPPERTDQEC